MAENDTKPTSAWDKGSAAGSLMRCVEEFNEASAKAKALGWSVQASINGTDYGDRLFLRLEWQEFSA